MRVLYAARAPLHALAHNAAERPLDRARRRWGVGMSRVSARIEDPEVLAMLEVATEEVGSKTDAIRLALRHTFSDRVVDDLDEDDPEDDDAVPAGMDVSPAARGAYAALVENYGRGRMIPLDAAESVIASATNTPTKSVRSVALTPLKSAGLISVKQHVHEVFVVIHEVAR